MHESEVIMDLGVARLKPCCLLQFGGSSGKILQQPVVHAKMVMRLGKVRARLDCQPELISRTQQVASVAQNVTQSIMGFRPVWPQADGSLIKTDGSVEVVTLLERATHVEVGLGEVGLERNRLPELHHRSVN